MDKAEFKRKILAHLDEIMDDEEVDDGKTFEEYFDILQEKIEEDEEDDEEEEDDGDAD